MGTLMTWTREWKECHCRLREKSGVPICRTSKENEKRSEKSQVSIENRETNVGSKTPGFEKSGFHFVPRRRDLVFILSLKRRSLTCANFSGT